MAVTLPGPQDLGALPDMTGARRIAGYDATPIATGARAIAQAVAQGGAAIAQGEEKLGAGIAQAGQAVMDVTLDRSRFQHALAHSGMQADMADLHASLANDQDFNTLEGRYSSAATAIRDKWAATIDMAPMRERFESESKPQIEQGLATAAAHAHRLWKGQFDANVTTLGEKNANDTVMSSDPKARALTVANQMNLIDTAQKAGVYTPMEALAKKQAWVRQYVIANGRAVGDSGDPGQIQAALDDLQAAPGSKDALVNRVVQAEGVGKNPGSSAAGVGQFTDARWLELVKAYRPELAKGQGDADVLAMRADANLGREMVGHNIDEGTAYLKSKGLEASPGNVYLTHFLGKAGAAAVLAADPKQPVAKVLSDAFGPAAAQQMVAANPGVLAGKQVGSVLQWADGKMGGTAAGGVHIYDYLPVQDRVLLRDHLQTALDKQGVDSHAALEQRVADTTAEAMNAGLAQHPVTQSEFVGALGVAQGQRAYQAYQGELQVGADRKRVAAMSPQQEGELLDKYEPQAGAGYAGQLARQQQIAKAIKDKHDLIREDTADYAIKNLPASAEAWGKLASTIADANASPDDKAAAARDFATKTRLEQAYVGVPEHLQTIVPKHYAEGLAAQLRNPQAAAGAGTVLARIASESKLWGDAWPQVYRQVAPKLDPTLRVVAAGVDPTAGKLLITNHAIDETKILGTQYAVKNEELREKVTDALAPIAKTFVADDTRVDYQTTANKLAAIYVAHGADPGKAATQAVNELIGFKYDIRDTYRVPHDAGVTADQVAAGVAAAKRDMAMLGPASGTPSEERSAAQARVAALDLATAADDVGAGADYARDHTPAAVARNGTWVTAPNEKGLMLSIAGNLWPSASDPKRPFVLTWQQLAKMGARDAVTSEPLTAGLAGEFVP